VSCPHDQRLRDGLATMPPRPRRGMGSIATAPLPLHGHRLVQGEQWRRSRQPRALRPRVRRPGVKTATRRHWMIAYLTRSRPRRLTHSVWTMPRRHSRGQYARTPRRTWSDHWSSRVASGHSSKPSKQLNCWIFLGYEASDA